MKAEIKTTGIYSGKQKPHRVGVYRRHHRDGFCMWSYWDGKQWGLAKLVPELAKPGKPSRWQNIPWQGLAYDHYGAAS